MDKKPFTFALAGLLAAIVVSLLAGHGYAATLIAWMAVSAVTAASMRFVLLIGELNFAVAAFFGIGAYSAGFVATAWGLPFLLALLVGGLVASAVSLVFGFITLKTKGPYFLLIGFAFTEVMRILYTKTSWLGRNSGLVGIFPPDFLEGYFHAFAVGVAGLLILALYAVEKSHWGRVFVAVRDNENVVRSVGIPVHAVKVLCFGAASFATGVAGSLQAFANNVISPPDFGFLLSTFTLAYLKVGGEQHPLGPVAGAVLLVLLGSVAQSFGGSEHIFYGAAIILAVLFLPLGLSGWVERRWPRRVSAVVEPTVRAEGGTP